MRERGPGGLTLLVLVLFPERLIDRFLVPLGLFGSAIDHLDLAALVARIDLALLVVLLGPFDA
jgi:hypothetical protein